MPDYRITEALFDIGRDAVMLDTNVLVAAFLPGEDSGRRDSARILLDYGDRPLLVPSVVVVETWGFMVGGRKAISAGLEFLSWLNSPNRAVVIPPHKAALETTQGIIRGLAVDCVDAMLVELATDISSSCQLHPPLFIATFDTSDFMRMFDRNDLRYSVIDMRTHEEIVFNR